VDKGPKSADPLNRHTVLLPRGVHTFVGTCELCEPGGASVSAEVRPGMDAVKLVVPLKPSLVSFDGFPPDALVRVGAEERTVAESTRRPFLVASPPEGSLQLRHQLHYEVRHLGKLLASGERAVVPGQPMVIDGRTP
jgi:hypothetical protein